MLLCRPPCSRARPRPAALPQDATQNDRETPACRSLDRGDEFLPFPGKPENTKPSGAPASSTVAMTTPRRTPRALSTTSPSTVSRSRLTFIRRMAAFSMAMHSQTAWSSRCTSSAPFIGRRPFPVWVRGVWGQVRRLIRILRGNSESVASKKHTIHTQFPKIHALSSRTNVWIPGIRIIQSGDDA